MANFILAIATVKTAYDNYKTKLAALAAVEASIATLGNAPVAPAVTLVDADWNNFVTALQTWQTSYDTLQADLKTAEDQKRTAELHVLTYLGYNSGDADNSIPYDEWIKVVGAGGGVLTYTDYIGFGLNSTYLQVTTTLPTQKFPNI